MNKYSNVNGAKYFSSNRLQNYLLFISTRHIDSIGNNTINIELWGFTGIFQESIKNPHTSDVNSAPKIIGNNKLNSIVEFKRMCLKQDSVAFLHKNIVNLYISYKLSTDFTLGDSLYGVVKLSKNADPDEYKYNGCSIRSDSCSQFLVRWKQWKICHCFWS